MKRTNGRLTGALLAITTGTGIVVLTPAGPPETATSRTPRCALTALTIEPAATPGGSPLTARHRDRLAPQHQALNPHIPAAPAKKPK